MSSGIEDFIGSCAAISLSLGIIAFIVAVISIVNSQDLMSNDLPIRTTLLTWDDNMLVGGEVSRDGTESVVVDQTINSTSVINFLTDVAGKGLKAVGTIQDIQRPNLQLDFSDLPLLTSVPFDAQLLAAAPDAPTVRMSVWKTPWSASWFAQNQSGPPVDNQDVEQHIFSSTGHDTLTIPAQSLVPGRCFQIKSGGTIATSSGSAALSIRLKQGTGQVNAPDLAEMINIATGTWTSPIPWTMNVTFTVGASSGLAETYTLLSIGSANHAACGSLTSLDWSVSNTLTLTAAWSAATLPTSELIYCDEHTVTQLF